MEDLIEKFIAYMLDVGFIKSKSEIFILKRRYTLMLKQAKEQNEQADSEENAYEFFIE